MANNGKLIADALVTYVNGETYSLSFTAEAPDNPVNALGLEADGDLHTDLRVIVVPTEETRERLDGSGIAVRPKIQVYFSAYLDGDHSTKAVLQDLVYEVVADLENRDMATDYCWQETEITALYDAEKLYSQHHFLSLVTLTYFDIQ